MRIFTFKTNINLFSFQIFFFSGHEYLPRFLNFTMVYNVFIFISIFLLPEIPENRGWTLYRLGTFKLIFFLSKCTYGFSDNMTVKRRRSIFVFYYNYQEFWIQYNTFSY